MGVSDLSQCQRLHMIRFQAKKRKKQKKEEDEKDAGSPKSTSRSRGLSLGPLKRFTSGPDKKYADQQLAKWPGDHPYAYTIGDVEYREVPDIKTGKPVNLLFALTKWPKPKMPNLNINPPAEKKEKEKSKSDDKDKDKDKDKGKKDKKKKKEKPKN